MKIRNPKNTTQKGGLDPLLKLPPAINNVDYDNLETNDDSVEIKNPDRPVVLNPDLPFVLSKPRRDWIAQFYPYAPYFIDIVKKIKWNEFNIDLAAKGVTIPPGMTVKLHLGYYKALPKYNFFGGIVTEILDKELEKIVRTRDLPRLHDYVAPTADIDVSIYFVITIVGRNIYYPYSDEALDIIEQINLIHIKKLILDELYLFIEDEVNRGLAIVSKHFNKSKSRSAAHARSVWRTLMRSIRATRKSSKSRSPVGLTFTREADRYRIMGKMKGNYEDHLMEFIPRIYCCIGEDDDETWFDVINLESSNIHGVRPVAIYNEFHNYIKINGYNLLGLDTILKRNTQLISSTDRLFGQEAKKEFEFSYYDKAMARLMRIKYILSLVLYLYNHGHAEIIGVKRSEEIIEKYIDSCLKNPSQPCPEFFVKLKNDDSRTFYRSFSVKEL
jgi:hypothetical protein